MNAWTGGGRVCAQWLMTESHTAVQCNGMSLTVLHVCPRMLCYTTHLHCVHILNSTVYQQEHSGYYEVIISASVEA